MQKMVCIPVERYEAMLRSYDEAMAEQEKIKTLLANMMNSSKKAQAERTVQA